MKCDSKMFKAACEQWLEGRRGEDGLLNAARESNPDAETVLMSNKETGETFCFICSSPKDAEAYEKSDKNIRNVGRIFDEWNRDGKYPQDVLGVYRVYIERCRLEEFLHIGDDGKGGM